MMLYSILQGADLLEQPVIPISGLDLTLAAGLILIALGISH